MLVALLLVTLAALVPTEATAGPIVKGLERVSGKSAAASEGLAEVLEVVIKAEDGIELHGWVGLPDETSDGTRVPVALVSTPYLGDCYFLAIPAAPPCDPTPAQESWLPGTPGWWADEPHKWAFRQWGVAPIDLVRRGYAAAFFSVRGTGNSGGCLEFFGPNEQRDQVTIVEWLAKQPWSTGRVAMGGESYPGSTALEAAIHSTGKGSPLKAVVSGVPITDAYTEWHTPQGANGSQNLWAWAPWPALSVTPAAGGGPVAASTSTAKTPQRVCSDVLKVLSEDKTEYVVDQRDAEFWSDRALIQHFPKVTAAVLFLDGFRNRGQVTQDSAVWESLVRAPKRQIQNQRRHDRADATYDPSWVHNEWKTILLGWLDYWLMGFGDRETLRVGMVDYLDDAGTWRASKNWPPAEAEEQVMYLAGDAVSPSTGSGSRTFRSVNDPRNNYWAGDGFFYDEDLTQMSFRPLAALCPEQPIATGAGVAALAYVSEPMAEPVTIAGNPFAYLRLVSDQEGGLVQVQIAAIRGDQQCDATGTPVGSKLLAIGVADLRYFHGNLDADPFPTDRPVNVRIDLWDMASEIAAGDRVAVVVSGSGGAPVEWADPKYAPRITVDAAGGLEASHVVLPIVKGTLGGSKPTLDYPPRPFVPQPQMRQGRRH